MKKIFKKILVLNFICLFLTSCQSKSSLPSEEKIDIHETMVNQVAEEKIVASDETVSCEEVYNLINNGEFYQNIMENPVDESMRDKMEEAMEIKQDSFSEVTYTGDLFPESLVYSVQEALYNASVSNVIDERDADFFFDLVEKLDPHYESHQIAEYELLSGVYWGPEFEFNSGDRKVYFRCHDLGGTSGMYTAELYTYLDGERTEITSFDSYLSGYGQVIQYEENFYYILLERNYNLKVRDGIRIYKLGENAETENILIRMIPDEYIWKNFYDNDAAPNDLKEYIDNIKEEITSDAYIDRGSDRDGPVIFYGDETEDKSFPGKEYMKGYYEPVFYQSDFTNLNCPIDFYRSVFISSNGLVMHLHASFYIYDHENGKAWPLDFLPGYQFFPHEEPLIQMWFKELDGKVYTFQIYHLNRYNYMLNVILVEGNQITQIRKDLLIPRCNIVMTEGERFWGSW